MAQVSRTISNAAYIKLAIEPQTQVNAHSKLHNLHLRATYTIRLPTIYNLRNTTKPSLRPRSRNRLA